MSSGCVYTHPLLRQQVQIVHTTCSIRGTIYISAWAISVARSGYIGQCESLQKWDEQQMDSHVFFCAVTERKLTTVSGLCILVKYIMDRIIKSHMRGKHYRPACLPMANQPSIVLSSMVRWPRCRQESRAGPMLVDSQTKLRNNHLGKSNEQTIINLITI